ncbi:MAG: hypothetical protein UY50_C0006G0038 [Parcubacteria group bacterium GW2011_GWA2_49_9]|nr:MAG: hypothetical protein UY50_C0006G0038 [Parcubacteria group bacterium GW2011_GWA2_49_9]
MNTTSSVPTPFPTQWHTVPAVPVAWMRQFRYFCFLFDKIHLLSGDIVECGLGEGSTFSMLAYLAGSEEGFCSRHVWGFDSFEGWPEPDVCDASPRNPKRGEWKVSEKQVRQRLAEASIFTSFPELELRLVAGFLSDSLPSAKVQQIAFLHLDVDLYRGYHDALTCLFPKVVSGGIVAFDEYLEIHPEPPYDGAEKWPGCSRAINEFFADRPEKIIYHLGAGKYYVIKESCPV